MKFNMDVECTPEEARAFLGLPDLKPIHDMYIKALMETMSGQANLEQMERMFRGVSPMGDAGMKFFSSMMDIGLGTTGSGSKGSTTSE